MLSPACSCSNCDSIKCYTSRTCSCDQLDDADAIMDPMINTMTCEQFKSEHVKSEIIYYSTPLEILIQTSETDNGINNTKTANDDSENTIDKELEPCNKCEQYKKNVLEPWLLEAKHRLYRERRLSEPKHLEELLEKLKVLKKKDDVHIAEPEVSQQNVTPLETIPCVLNHIKCDVRTSFPLPGSSCTLLKPEILTQSQDSLVLITEVNKISRSDLTLNENTSISKTPTQNKTTKLKVLEKKDYVHIAEPDVSQQNGTPLETVPCVLNHILCEVRTSFPLPVSSCTLLKPEILTQCQDSLVLVTEINKISRSDLSLNENTSISITPTQNTTTKLKVLEKKDDVHIAEPEVSQKNVTSLETIPCVSSHIICDDRTSFPLSDSSYTLLKPEILTQSQDSLVLITEINKISRSDLSLNEKTSINTTPTQNITTKQRKPERKLAAQNIFIRRPIVACGVTLPMNNPNTIKHETAILIPVIKDLPEDRSKSKKQNIMKNDVIQQIMKACKICSCKNCECLSYPPKTTESKNYECLDCQENSRNTKPKGLWNLTYPNIIATAACGCRSCKCIVCEAALINQNCNQALSQPLVVAPVGDTCNFNSHCQCRNCECVQCSADCPTIRSATFQATHEISTGVDRHPNCRCESCNNDQCAPDFMNSCLCERKNGVMHKPITSLHDYEIRAAICTRADLFKRKMQLLTAGADDSVDSFKDPVKVYSIYNATSESSSIPRRKLNTHRKDVACTANSKMDFFHDSSTSTELISAKEKKPKVIDNCISTIIEKSSSDDDRRFHHRTSMKKGIDRLASVSLDQVCLNKLDETREAVDINTTPSYLYLSKSWYGSQDSISKNSTPKQKCNSITVDGRQLAITPIPNKLAKRSQQDFKPIRTNGTENQNFEQMLYENFLCTSTDRYFYKDDHNNVDNFMKYFFQSVTENPCELKQYFRGTKSYNISSPDDSDYDKETTEYIQDTKSLYSDVMAKLNQSLSDRYTYTVRLTDTLSEAKAFSQDLVKILDKYERANNEFKSILNDSLSVLQQNVQNIKCIDNIKSSTKDHPVQDSAENSKSPEENSKFFLKIPSMTFNEDNINIKFEKPPKVLPDNKLRNPDKLGWTKSIIDLLPVLVVEKSNVNKNASTSDCSTADSNNIKDLESPKDDTTNIKDLESPKDDTSNNHNGLSSQKESDTLVLVVDVKSTRSKRKKSIHKRYYYPTLKSAVSSRKHLHKQECAPGKNEIKSYNTVNTDNVLEFTNMNDVTNPVTFKDVVKQEKTNLTQSVDSSQPDIEEKLKPEYASIEMQQKKSAGYSSNSLEVGALVVQRLSKHSALVKWAAPRVTQQILGYELLVDGKSINKKMAPGRCVAVVTCLPSQGAVISVRAVTAAGVAREPASGVV